MKKSPLSYTTILRHAVKPHSWGASYAALMLATLLVFCAANAQNRAVNPRTEAAASVLSSGRWVKLRIRQTGVHQLTADMLKKWGFSDPTAVSVWGNGCRGLPRLNNEPAPDDLQQMATKISGGKILFYAEAKNTWRHNTQKNFFEHEQNEYSDVAYIYITDSWTVRDISLAAQAAQATDITDTYDYRDYRERIDTNLMRSGRRFFGEVYDAVRQHSLSFSVPSLYLANPELTMQVCAAARSTTGSTYSISVNDGSPYTLTITPVTQNVDYMKADTILFKNIPVSSENITLKITYNRPENSPSAWGVWDFTTINARASLRLLNSQLTFRDAKTMGAGRATQFNIATSQQNVSVWDVTDLHRAQEVGGLAASGNISFAVETPTLREFVAFTDNMLLTPEYVGETPNQNLHGAAPPELVIVTHPSLAAQANRLAKFHREKDNMSVLTVTTEEVYNEFSGGLPDVSAIRNFMRMFYRRRDVTTPPKYLLLFGSGTYVNHEGKKGVGLIPTFQSENSLESERSYVSDDFFVLLGDGEHLGDNGMVGDLDMAVGRIPARSETEAATLVDKIEQYHSTLDGDWMSKCIIIADDEDGGEHMRQAEIIGSYIMDSAPSSYYYVNKIYLDAYQQRSTSMGERYPDVTDDINSAIRSGALLVNYTGHANDQWLSHEQVVTISDIKRWDNRNRLPLFVTATCEFSRFDSPYVRSAGEQVLFLPNGGGIAMLSTTRLVYSGANSALNQKFIEEFFRKDASGNHARIGEMVRRTKNASTTGVNQLNFSLLGDPALMLHFPSYTAQAGSINPDTLKALSRAIIDGSVNNSVNSSAGGDILYVSVFDKEQVKQTLGNSRQTPFAYRTQSSLLYRGKVSVTPNEKFTAKFVVPRDIIPSYGKGKITYVGKAGGALAAGCDSVQVGGISNTAIADTTPPSVRMYMNDEQWVSGGTTTEAPTLIALLADSSGINITGNGAGRDMTLTLQPVNKTYILNSYYTANTNSYTSGRVEFPIPPLEKGRYTATIKVWDVANNFTEQSIEFRVEEDERFTLNRVLNYPNPFTQKTAFFFEHNRPYTEMEVIIQIFTVTGKLVKTIRSSAPPSSASLRSVPIEWDGRDDYGDRLGRGTYLYKIKARCNNAAREYAEKVEKLVLLS